jgi:hypothetical protein
VLDVRLAGAPPPPPAAPLSTAKLWRNAHRGDVVFCASPQCDSTQQASGYALLSADEGSTRLLDHPGAPPSRPLYFSWSASNQDNWVTSSRPCPGAAYTSCGNPDGRVYAEAAKGRLAITAFRNANGTHHMAAATPKMKRWALAHGYSVTFSSTGPLGWLDPPGGSPAAPAPPRPPPPASSSRRRVAGILALPPNIMAEGPMTIRVHFARLCSAAGPSRVSRPGFLSLLWSAHNRKVPMLCWPWVRAWHLWQQLTVRCAG